MKKYRTFSVAMHILLLVLLLTPVGSEGAQSGTCADRTLILLQGIDTRYEYGRENFQDILQQIGHLYQRVAYFSYNRDNPLGYGQTNTFQHLSHSVAALTSTVKREIEMCPGMSIDMIGHSLGGLVALTYLGFREHETDTAHVKHLITLDSPVNGSSRHTIAFISDLFGWDVAESDMGRILVQLKQEVKREVNITLAERLREKTVIRTIGSQDDLVVPFEDSTIPGFELEFFLGSLLTWDQLEISCRKEEMRSICAGHDQVLRNPNVIAQIHSILSWSPPEKVSSEEEGRTSSGVAVLAQPDGRLHVAWLSYERVVVSEQPLTVGTRNRRIYYRQMSPDGAWSHIYDLPGCGLTPVLTSHPDGSVWIFAGEVATCAYRVRSDQAPRFDSTVNRQAPAGLYINSAIFDDAGTLHVLWPTSSSSMRYGYLEYFTRLPSGQWARPQGWIKPDLSAFVRGTAIVQDKDRTVHLAFIEDAWNRNISRVYHQRNRPSTGWSDPEVILDAGEFDETADSVALIPGQAGVCVLARSFGSRVFGYLQCANNNQEWVGSEELPDFFSLSSAKQSPTTRTPDQTLHVIGTSQDRTRLKHLYRQPNGIWSNVLDLPDTANIIFSPTIVRGPNGNLHTLYSAGSQGRMEVYHTRSST